MEPCEGNDDCPAAKHKKSERRSDDPQDSCHRRSSLRTKDFIEDAIQGLKNVCEDSIPSSVPEGRLNLAQDASPRLDSKGRPSPAGTAENRPQRNPGQPSAVPAGLNHVA
jgi:hypothetical protein